MRYLVPVNKESEIKAREAYLYKTCKMFFVPMAQTDGFITLVPIGTADPSVLFIVGHYNQVMRFLNKNIKTIEEKTVVLVTCGVGRFKAFKNHRKEIFGAVTNHEDRALLYPGENYNLDFPVTESELNFYNSSESDIMKRVHKSFGRL